MNAFSSLEEMINWIKRGVGMMGQIHIEAEISHNRSAVSKNTHCHSVWNLISLICAKYRVDFVLFYIWFMLNGQQQHQQSSELWEPFKMQFILVCFAYE